MTVKRGASAIIRRPDGKILIARRSLNKTYSPGVWEAVGGAIESGETPDECIRREIWEELSTGVDYLEFFRKYSYPVAPEMTVAIDVFIVELAGDPFPNEDEIEIVRWIGRDEVETYDFFLEAGQRFRDYFALADSFNRDYDSA